MLRCGTLVSVTLQWCAWSRPRERQGETAGVWALVTPSVTQRGPSVQATTTETSRCLTFEPWPRDGRPILRTGWVVMQSTENFGVMKRLASSPGPFPAFHCCTSVCSVQQWKAGNGPGDEARNSSVPHWHTIIIAAINYKTIKTSRLILWFPDLWYLVLVNVVWCVQVCYLEFDRKDIPMNKMVVTSLESKFSIFDLRTQHPTKGFASLTEKV